ncbi:MAG: hypothetical protein PHN88_00810 [Ignavibacteria bacterium]|nr:hypothetical protein [Ignavibacteria bacterium]
MMVIHDIELLKLNKNFDIAYSILKDILEQRCPDIRKIELLYGTQKSKTLQDLIKNFIIKNLSGTRIMRPHNPGSPMEIILARREIEKDGNYQKVHSFILLNKLPDIKSLENFYGNYSVYVQKIIKQYIQLNLKRKCEIGAATHLNRVGAVVFQLKMNDTGKYNYSSTAVMHDSIEDLVRLKKSKKGTGVDTEKYSKFLDEHIPADLQDKVKILTNHYNLILNYVLGRLEEDDKAFTKKNILAELEILVSQKTKEFSRFAEKMQSLISETDAETDLLDAIKWECYKTLYLEGIAKETSKKNDHRIYEIKGVDLSDNAHGKGALSIDARIRNINKNLMWGIKGYAMKSTWKPFNDHIQEVIEDAYQSAEYLVLGDMLQPYSSTDFMMSALNKIIKMENVFYI